MGSCGYKSHCNLVLCPWDSHFILSDFAHDYKVVDWDIKHQLKLEWEVVGTIPTVNVVLCPWDSHLSLYLLHDYKVVDWHIKHQLKREWEVVGTNPTVIWCCALGIVSLFSVTLHMTIKLLTGTLSINSSWNGRLWVQIPL